MSFSKHHAEESRDTMRLTCSASRWRQRGRTTSPRAWIALTWLVQALPGAAIPLQAQPQFVNITGAVGITSVHQPSGPFIFSIYNYAPFTAGGAIGDFNRDGLQDIFVLCSGGFHDALYINNGDGTFSNQAQAWGVHRRHMGIGATVADFNNNGWPDIFITSLGNWDQQPGAGRHILYRNNGDGSFTNVAAQAGVNFTSPVHPDGFSACFGDVNRNGRLDLFAASWANNTNGNRLFINNGDGTFSNATGPGLAIEVPPNVRGFTPIIADIDGDRSPEILLAADFYTSKGYFNNGDGSFTESTALMGIGLDANGMGAALGDLTGNGFPDYFVTSIYSAYPGNPGIPGTGNMLYINNGHGAFGEQSNLRGVKQGGWGWGTVFVDIDNDGDLDIIMVNGWHGANPSGVFEYVNRPSLVFVNDGSGFFTERAQELGLAHVSEGRGLAVLDIDNNGAMDVVIFSNQGPTALYKNTLDVELHRSIRIAFDTRRHACIPPDGFHTTVRARIGPKEIVRTLHTGNGFLTSSEPVIHIGCGAALSIDELIIEWPNGETAVYNNVATNQMLTITPVFHGDSDRNGVVDMNDLAMVLEQFGQTGDGLWADLNADGVIDADDLGMVLGAYGSSCFPSSGPIPKPI